MGKRDPLDGDVVVVGAGVAGLTTAIELQKAGASVKVIEKSPILGGLARSWSYDGFVFDVGPHRFHTENPKVSEFVNGILQGDSTWFPRVSEVYFEGSYYSWPLKPQNLIQLPPVMAAKSALDLAINNFREYDIDSFENYVLRQYGPTLYDNFFKGYSQKFLGLHPRDTHPDWAKVGINRAIIDNNLQMQNLSQLLKTTLLQFRTPDETRFLYPKSGMQQTWDTLGRMFVNAGGTIHAGVGAVMEGENNRVVAVHAGDQATYHPSTVVWTAPITLAQKQLGLDVSDLEYLGLICYNVCLSGGVPRDYQWCYYGASDLLINRVSIPRFFSDRTAPPGMTGICSEVTCRKDDERWKHAERLTDHVVNDLIKVGMIKRRSDVHNVHVERVADSYPIYHKNYTGHLEKARAGLSQFENLELAGRTGLFWYNNMDHSIENGLQLAEKLLAEGGKKQSKDKAKRA